MGNLMAETTNIELSLWPDTKYNVRVTCTNQKSQKRISSLPLVVDTSKAIGMRPESSEQEYELVTGGGHRVQLHAATTITNDDATMANTRVQQSRRVIPKMQKEIILGMCLALVVFLGMLTVFLALRTVARGVDKRLCSSKNTLPQSDTVFVVNV